MQKVFRYLIVFCCLLFFCLSSADELKITSFRPLSYRVFGLNTLLGLTHYYYGADFCLDGCVRSYYSAVNDTTEFITSLYVHSRWRDSDVSINFSPSSFINHYLSGRSLFLHNKVDLHISFSRHPSFEWQRYINATGEFGAGIGHIRDGKYIVLALYINDILKKENIIKDNLNDETIRKIARVIANERFYVLKHERYLKYLFEELEKIIREDPVCNGKIIPAFVWFKIVEVAKGHSFYHYIIPDARWRWNYRFTKHYSSNLYWQRLFGSKFSFIFVASDINDYDTLNPYTRVPFTDSFYYRPLLLFMYEYHYPRDLRNQISLGFFYKIDLSDTNSYHDVKFSYSYGYGIIDFFLVSGSITLGFDANKDLKSRRAFVISPLGEFDYYLEDCIVLKLEVAVDFEFEKLASQSDYISQSQWLFDLGVDWRIF